MIGFILTKSSIDFTSLGFSSFHFMEFIEVENSDGSIKDEHRACIVTANEIEFEIDILQNSASFIEVILEGEYTEKFDNTIGLTRIEFQKLKIKPYEKD